LFKILAIQLLVKVGKGGLDVDAGQVVFGLEDEIEQARTSRPCVATGSQVWKTRSSSAEGKDGRIL